MTTHIYTRASADGDRCRFARLASRLFKLEKFSSVACILVTDCRFDSDPSFLAVIGRPHGEYAIGADWKSGPPCLAAIPARSKPILATVYSVRPHDMDDPMWQGFVEEIRKYEVINALRTASGD